MLVSGTGSHSNVQARMGPWDLSPTALLWSGSPDRILLAAAFHHWPNALCITKLITAVQNRHFSSVSRDSEGNVPEFVQQEALFQQGAECHCYKAFPP